MRKVILIILLMIVMLMPTGVYAQRGCCSHHGGVAGCSSSGRQVCRDGTLSPTCTCSGGSSSNNSGSSGGSSSSGSSYRNTTPSYVYGCTDSSAFNYNPNANKDNGTCIAKKYGCIDSTAINYDATANTDNESCKYQKEIKETEIVKYKTKYRKNSEIFIGKENEVQEGVNGKKEVTYNVVVDKNGSVISKEKISEKILEEPVEQIIEQGAKESNGSLFPLIWLVCLISSIVYFNSHKDGNLLLNKISKYNKVVKIILYILYVTYVIPAFIDFVIIIINFFKNIKNGMVK